MKQRGRADRRGTRLGLPPVRPYGGQSGANIRGMYVNGEPAFSAEDYYENQQESEARAKCEVIAAALDGKRIAAVPVKDGLPVESRSVPVLTIDMVEPTLILWEKMLAFFGFGRSVRMREANSLNEDDRSCDENYIGRDLRNSGDRERNNKLNAAREKMDFSELLGSSPKRVERHSSTSSFQREHEKSMGGMSNK